MSQTKDLRLIRAVTIMAAAFIMAVLTLFTTKQAFAKELPENGKIVTVKKEEVKEKEEAKAKTTAKVKEEKDEEKDEDKLITMFAKQSVFIREKPDRESEAISWIDVYKDVEVFEVTKEDEWAKVTFKTQVGDEEIENIGYVFTYYLTEEDLTEEREEYEKEKGKAAEQAAAPTPAQTTPGTPYRSVAGAFLPAEYQDFAYRACRDLGIEYYYQTLLCQMYQESRFNQGAVSPTQDYGLMQLNIRYHDAFKARAGHPEWDVINDPYANMYTGIVLMRDYLAAFGGNVELALTAYNRGPQHAYVYGVYQPYIDQVMQWMPTLS